MADIPVVSLFGDEKEVIRKLDAAFRDVGFVFVVHHSILPHQVRLVSRSQTPCLHFSIAHVKMRRGSGLAAQD